MAFKQGIPQSWIHRQANVAKLPHVYNPDDAVGLNCPNRRVDVMLLQFLRSLHFARMSSLWSG
jgi:hypothetical protein